MKYSIQRFNGLVPRYDKHTQTQGGFIAHIAKDVNLYHGTLKPFREKEKIKTLSKDTRSLFYDSRNCCWTEFPECNVSFAKIGNECFRSVATGVRDYPITSCEGPCNSTNWIRLGLPIPEYPLDVYLYSSLKTYDKKLNLDSTKGMDRAIEGRVYVYTYVNSCCDEGPPSVPSEVIKADDDSVVSISGFEIPPEEYGVTKIRLYRLAPPFSGDSFEKPKTSVEHGSVFLFVDEIDVDTRTYLDDKKAIDLGDPLETSMYAPPPDDLSGVVAINGVRFAGITEGNKIRFSVPSYPHNWEEAQELTLPYNIVKLVPLDRYLIALTTKYNYIISPLKDCATGMCREVNQLPEEFPIINSCIHTGVVTTPYGVFYPSLQGMVQVSLQGNSIYTYNYFSYDDWQELLPDTMTVGYYHDTLYFTSAKGTWVLKIEGLTDKTPSFLTKISDSPDYFITADNTLLLVEGQNVYQWDSGDKLRPYVWQSNYVLTNYDFNFAGALVNFYNDGYSLSFELKGDDDIIYETELSTEKKFRLPSGRVDNRFAIKLEGTHTVYNVSIGSSYRELVG